MPNYYDNKGKNLFVMFSIFASFIAAIFQWTVSLFSLSYWVESNIWEAVRNIILNIPTLIAIFSYLSLLVFAVLIFKDYKFKKWMLPIYFGISCGLQIYSFINSIYLYSKYQMTYNLNIGSIISIIILALLFVGSLNNFNYILVFKIALVALTIQKIYAIFYCIFILIANYYDKLGTPSFGTNHLLSLTNIFSMVSLFVGLFFPISLLVLTTRKKEPPVETDTTEEQ